MTPSEAFAILGVSHDVDVDSLKRAWRRQCSVHHPDVGGSEAEMRRLNEAYRRCRDDLARRDSDVTASRPAPEDSVASATPLSEHQGRAFGRWGTQSPRRVEREVCSFVIEALPVVAFEALIAAGELLGTIIDDDPPYLLDVDLVDPVTGWCRLELVPDAGSTTVSVTVIDAVGDRCVDTPVLDQVRDRWVAVLNALPMPD